MLQNNVYGYFDCQFFTYYLSSVVHSATLISSGSWTGWILLCDLNKDQNINKLYAWRKFRFFYYFNWICMVLIEPIMILLYFTSSINSVMNMHKFNFLFITYLPKRTLNCKKKIIFYKVTLMFSALLTLCLQVRTAQMTSR